MNPEVIGGTDDHGTVRDRLVSQHAERLWSDEASRKNYGDDAPTSKNVELMEARLKKMEDQIQDLFARGEAIQEDIEKGKNTPGLPEDAKARVEAVLTKEKMDLGKQAEGLEKEKSELAERLDRMKKLLGLEGGLPPIEYPTPTVH
ncbi:MAG: hypothetical protein WAU28_04270 [Candidatus Moraniibacteriota bacterium]